jgi:hypothetical protein
VLNSKPVLLRRLIGKHFTDGIDISVRISEKEKTSGARRRH